MGGIATKVGVVVADPPWSFADRLTMAPIKRGAASNYATLSTKDLCALPVKDVVENDAVLALWCPQTLLVDGLAVMEAWGFTYKTLWTWVKQTPNGKLHFGMGHWFRASCETVLFGVRGKPKNQSRRERSVFIGPAGKHSEKPEALQDSLDLMFPEGRRLELFARRWRDGWLCTGLELDGCDVREALEVLR